VKSIIVVTTVAVVTLAAGCASAPKRSEQLEQARAEVETLAQDPKASQTASQELKDARTALQQADSALADKRPIEEVNHLAYLAERYAEIGKARLQETQAREQIAQGEAERNRVLLEARTSEAQRAQASAQTEAERAEAARQEALAARTDLESARKELSDLQAKQTERGMVLTLGDVLFDTNASTLKQGAAEHLDRLATYLSQNEGTRIIIEGHTDSRGAESYNEELSRRRAQAVADALVTRGVPSNRFDIIGRGEAAPVANNESSAGRQQNRRVEIIFSDNSGKFAQGATTSGALR
jgi:outer membrane protein OmpA-like peptidoglycan-associated protein